MQRLKQHRTPIARLDADAIAYAWGRIPSHGTLSWAAIRVEAGGYAERADHRIRSPSPNPLEFRKSPAADHLQR